MPWRKERLPTPIFWPGEFHGLHSPWGHRESDRTVTFTFTTFMFISIMINMPLKFTRERTAFSVTDAEIFRIHVREEKEF